jgi:predicted N-acetyltransferase YhbS
MSALPPISPEEPADAAAVEALIDQAFGPGRFVKSAERLREGNHPAPGLSVVAREDGRVVGCARMWPVKAAGRKAILLGPFAVDPKYRRQGLGGALVEAACERAREAGEALVVLVGDAAFFDKLGFERAKLTLPGPVDARRVMALALKPGAADGLDGPVTLP